MLLDYHTHTILSDGKNTHEEMITQAIKVGLAEYGFSDHVCLKPVSNKVVQPNSFELMTKIITRLKAKHQDIEIKYGIEMDYFPYLENKIKKAIDSLPLDYVIGSVHFIDEWIFDLDATGYAYRDINEIYETYFDLIQKAARSKLFDIIGHTDIIKIFNYRPTENMDALYDETARIFKENNMVAEINTNGINRPCREIYPSTQILEKFKKYDVEITFGSDAHVQARVGQFFDVAVKILNQLGFKYYVSFTNRQKKYLALPAI